MKKFITPSLIILILLSYSPNFASHFMGGEITWECIPSGQPDSGKYIFTLKVYRECAGIQFGTTQTLSSNSPAGSIYLTEIAGWPKDISPVCNSDTTLSHLSCAGTVFSNTGAVEEHIYKSQPIQLNGTPPVTGWMFYWGSCCRNPSTNIQNATSKSWRLRAIMYPYGNKNAYPCFDNSPAFAEPPTTVLTTGYDAQINQLTFDNDFDSLYFEWGEPLTSNNSPLYPYISGYSYTNPLPDANKNPNNVAATINHQTGTISFKSFTSGAFVTCTKITAFKNHIKVAEIWREIQIVLAHDTMNLPPAFSTNSPNLMDTVIFIGDSISLQLMFTDSQLLPNGKHQSISISHSSNQFGSFIPPANGQAATLSTTSGCKHPPCASLTPASGPNFPVSDSFNVSTNFYWKADCNHLKKDTNGYPITDTFYYAFYISGSDDYCPIPASITKTIRIGVTAGSELPAPVLDSVKFDYSANSMNIYWTPVNDPDSQFISYLIYYAPHYNGTMVLVDSVTNLNTSSYAHQFSEPTNGFYKLRTLSSLECNCKKLSGFSNGIERILTDIDQADAKPDFLLFTSRPNPAKDNTTIDFYINKAGDVRMQILDLSGRVILSGIWPGDAGNNEKTIDLSKLSSGVYYLVLEYQKQRRLKKLVIQK